MHNRNIGKVLLLNKVIIIKMCESNYLIDEFS